jgi:hypothetical protein
MINTGSSVNNLDIIYMKALLKEGFWYFTIDLDRCHIIPNLE